MQEERLSLGRELGTPSCRGRGAEEEAPKTSAQKMCEGEVIDIG